MSYRTYKMRYRVQRTDFEDLQRVMNAMDDAEWLLIKVLPAQPLDPEDYYTTIWRRPVYDDEGDSWLTP